MQFTGKDSIFEIASCSARKEILNYRVFIFMLYLLLLFFAKSIKEFYFK